MAELGFYLMFVALGVAALGVVTSLMGAALRSRALIESGQRSTLALAGLLTLGLLLLVRLFLSDDFAVQYVAEHSSSTTPALYTVTAVWGGQAGSLLLWVWAEDLGDQTKAREILEANGGKDVHTHTRPYRRDED